MGGLGVSVVVPTLSRTLVGVVVELVDGRCVDTHPPCVSPFVWFGVEGHFVNFRLEITPRIPRFPASPRCDVFFFSSTGVFFLPFTGLILVVRE